MNYFVCRVEHWNWKTDYEIVGLWKYNKYDENEILEQKKTVFILKLFNYCWNRDWEMIGFFIMKISLSKFSNSPCNEIGQFYEAHLKNLMCVSNVDRIV